MDGRIAVTVVAGGSRSGKSRLIRQLRDRTPPGERWAWLDNSVGVDNSVGGGQDEPVSAGDGVDPGQYFQLAGGCACCVAGAAFRVTLVRLLRAGPWNQLHIEVDPAGHGHALVDQLRSAPFDQYLTVSRLVVTVQPAEAALYQNADRLLQPMSRLAMATDILLRSSSGGGTSADAAFEAWLQTAPPWPRLAQAGQARQESDDTRLPAKLSGWRSFSLAEPACTSRLTGPQSLSAAQAPKSSKSSKASKASQASQASCVVGRWPAAAIGQRREVKALLAALAGRGDIIGFQALVRTPRAWYCWTFGHGSGAAGTPAFDAGLHLAEIETAWRLDNRICIWLRRTGAASGGRPDGAGLGSLEALEALKVALAGSDSAGADSFGSPGWHYVTDGS